MVKQFVKESFVDNFCEGLQPHLCVVQLIRVIEGSKIGIFIGNRDYVH